MSEPLSLRYDRVPDRLYWRAMRAACAPTKAQGGRVRTWVMMFLFWLVLMFVMALLLRLPAFRDAGPAFLAGRVVMWGGLMGFGRSTRARMQRTLDLEQTRRGPTQANLGPDGVVFTSSFGETRILWRAIDAIVDLATGTGLKVGLLVYPIPNEALPDNLSPAAFRERLTAWQSEATA